MTDHDQARWKKLADPRPGEVRHRPKPAARTDDLPVATSHRVVEAPASLLLSPSVNPASATLLHQYNGFNQLLSVTSPSGVPTTFGYDGNGNQTSRTDVSGTTTYAYNLDNRLVDIAGPAGTSHFEYDANGLRTKKSDATGTRSYLLDGLSVVAEYAPDASKLAWYTQSLARIDEVLSVVNGQGKFWYETDALGSTYAMMNAAGGVVSRSSYDVFGERALASAYDVAQPFGFTGREQDPSGLVYSRARYLQPVVGRWVAADPAGLADGLNRYGYVRGAPTILTDPLGLRGAKDFFVRHLMALGNSPTVLAALETQSLVLAAAVIARQSTACWAAAQLVDIALSYADSPDSAATALFQYGYLHVSRFSPRGSSGFKTMFRAVPESDDNVHHVLAVLAGSLLWGDFFPGMAALRDAQQAMRSRGGSIEGEINDMMIDITVARSLPFFRLLFKSITAVSARDAFADLFCQSCSWEGE